MTDTADTFAEKISAGTDSEEGWYSEGGKRVYEWSNDFSALAPVDIVQGFRHWPLWRRMGWQDVVLRYRRSMLGPFWLTLSTGIMVVTLGLLYGGIFNISTQEYLPYLTMGLLTWSLITGAVTEGCQTFIDAEWLIRQVDLPLSLYPMRITWRNLIIFLHNAPIFVVMALIFPIPLGWVMLLAIPGLIVLLANVLWCATLLGMLVARFRDLAQIVNSLLQVAFFVTPIFWSPAQMPNRQLLINGNPFYHFIEVVRGPLLGKAPTLLNWEVVLLITVVGHVVTFFFYRRFYGRIAYWI